MRRTESSSALSDSTPAALHLRQMTPSSRLQPAALDSAQMTPSSRLQSPPRREPSEARTRKRARTVPDSGAQLWRQSQDALAVLGALMRHTRRTLSRCKRGSNDLTAKPDIAKLLQKLSEAAPQLHALNVDFSSTLPIPPIPKDMLCEAGVLLKDKHPETEEYSGTDTADGHLMHLSDASMDAFEATDAVETGVSLLNRVVGALVGTCHRDEARGHVYDLVHAQSTEELTRMLQDLADDKRWLAHSGSPERRPRGRPRRTSTANAPAAVPLPPGADVPRGSSCTAAPAGTPSGDEKRAGSPKASCDLESALVQCQLEAAAWVLSSLQWEHRAAIASELDKHTARGGLCAAAPPTGEEAARAAQ